MKTKEKILIFVFGVVFLGLGIFMIVYSGTFNRQERDFSANAKSVVAYVDRIESNSYHQGKSYKTSFTAWVTYEVEGVTYTNIKLSEGAGRLTEGTNAVIYYHQDDPTWIRAYNEDKSFQHIIVKIAGGLFCIFGGFAVLGAFVGKPHPKYKRTVYTKNVEPEIRTYESDVEDYR